MTASTLLEPGNPSSLPSQPPLAPTVDQAYLRRLETLLAATDASVAEALEIGHASVEACSKKKRR